MLVFTFSVSHRKHPFWTIWSQKSKLSVWAEILYLAYFEYVKLFLFLQVLFKKYFLHFDVTWLIFQQFTCRDLKPVDFLVKWSFCCKWGQKISKAFDRVWHAGLLYKLKTYEFSDQIFDLVSSCLSNRRLRLVLDGKSSEEYPVNAGVYRGSILGSTFFLLYALMAFLMMLSVILLSMLMILLSILSVIRHLICGSN